MAKEQVVTIDKLTVITKQPKKFIDKLEELAKRYAVRKGDYFFKFKVDEH